MSAHIAIMREPYLARVLSGEKIIEARFLRVRAAPYGRVAPGDPIGLKRVGGPIIAATHAADVRHYAELTPARAGALIAQFADGLRLEPDFIAHARERRYAVLIWLAAPRRLPAPLRYAKRDLRGWIVLERAPWLD